MTNARARGAIAAAGLGLAALPHLAHAAVVDARDPAWLQLAHGTVAAVDAAPWDDGTHAAALVSTPAAAGAIPELATQPPAGVIRRHAGFPVVVVRRLSDGVVEVRGLTSAGPHLAYTHVDRLVPRVPTGTRLVVAGGFAGYALLYDTLDEPPGAAQELATGTRVTAVGTATGAAPGETIGLVRLHVRVRSGPLRGQAGWLATGYTGLARPPAASSSATERACRCRVIEFR